MDPYAVVMRDVLRELDQAAVDAERYVRTQLVPPQPPVRTLAHRWGMWMYHRGRLHALNQLREALEVLLNPKG